MARTVTILHSAGCSGAPEAIRLASELAEERDDIVIESRLIEDERQALATGFRGSPTVLVDGEDVEEAPEPPVGAMG